MSLDPFIDGLSVIIHETYYAGKLVSSWHQAQLRTSLKKMMGPRACPYIKRAWLHLDFAKPAVLLLHPTIATNRGDGVEPIFWIVPGLDFIQFVVVTPVEQ
jgi:hypothetical protein